MQRALTYLVALVVLSILAGCGRSAPDGDAASADGAGSSEEGAATAGADAEAGGAAVVEGEEVAEVEEWEPQPMPYDDGFPELPLDMITERTTKEELGIQALFVAQEERDADYIAEDAIPSRQAAIHEHWLPEMQALQSLWQSVAADQHRLDLEVIQEAKTIAIWKAKMEATEEKYDALLAKARIDLPPVLSERTKEALRVWLALSTARGRGHSRYCSY